MSEQDAVDYLLLDEGAVLWDRDVWPEVARFLRLKAAQLSQSSLQRIIDAIEAGPPRSIFEGDDNEFHAWREWVVAQRLAKLQQAGVELSDALKAKASSASSHSEEVILQPQVRRVPPETADDILALAADDAAKVIIKQAGSWSAGEKLEDVAKRNEKKALEVVKSLLQYGVRDQKVWWGLSGFHSVDSLESMHDILSYVLTYLNEYPWWTDVAAKELARLLAALSERLPPEDEKEEHLLSAWRVVWKAADRHDYVDENPADHKDYVDAAINSAGGKLAEALLDRIWSRKLKPGESLPRDLVDLFNGIVDGDSRTVTAHRPGFRMPGRR